MKIESFAFPFGDDIPSRFTCDGENINPELTFNDVLSNAKSLALIVEDPDAPGGTWNHWILWNIPPKTNEINQNSVPTGAVVGLNSNGENKYTGPCPPDGEHRYFFRLYALDIMLPLKENSTKKELLSAMSGHILDEVELIGLYKRQ